MFNSLEIEDMSKLLEDEFGSDSNMNFHPVDDMDLLGDDDLFGNNNAASKLAPSSVSSPAIGSTSFKTAAAPPSNFGNATFDLDNIGGGPSLSNARFNIGSQSSRLPKSSVGSFLQQRKQTQQAKQSLMQRSMSASAVRSRPNMGNSGFGSSNATFDMKPKNPVSSFLQRQNQLKEQAQEQNRMSKSFSMNSVRKRNFGTIDEHQANANFGEDSDPQQTLMRNNSVSEFLKNKQRSSSTMNRSMSHSLMRGNQNLNRQQQQHGQPSQTLTAILSTHNLKKARRGSIEMQGEGNASFGSMQASRTSTNPFLKSMTQSNSQAFAANKSRTNPFLRQMSQQQMQSTSKSNFVFAQNSNSSRIDAGGARMDNGSGGGGGADQQQADGSLLHNSCKLYPDNLEVVESALQLDPSSVRRQIPTFCSRPSKSILNRSGKDGKYSYPVNIAIFFQATLDIVRLLATNGPDVLAMIDGPDKAGSLSIAVACNNASLPVVELLLEVNPETASVADRHGNYALHRIVQTLPTVQTVTAVYKAFPEALSKRNFHGKTPLDLAVHNITCPEQVLNAVQRWSFSRMERDAQHL